MHPSVIDWAAQRVNALRLADGITLEVGSLNVNGTVRDLFAGPYIGVDMRPGPGVDQVATAAHLPFPDNSFDTVVSTEMLEHDATFWLSIVEMARVLKPGGHLLLTARGNGFPTHDYPADYWRFSVSAFRSLFVYAGLFIVEVRDDPDPHSPGVFGHATK